jgi:hypothetical protein
MRWLVIAFASCLSPTEITVEITTDLPCAQIDRTQIFVGPPDRLGPASGETRACSNNAIGTIVLTPSARGGDVQVRAVTTVKGGRCDDTVQKGCIRADRRARFISHMPLHLPIEMTAACIDILCPLGQTCIKGACAPIPVLDMDAGTIDSDSGIDSGIDSGSDSGMDAGADAASYCAPPQLVMNMPAPSLAWHFDEGMGTTTNEEAMRVSTAMIGGTWTAGPSGCHSALAFNNSPTTLGNHPALASNAGITIAFYLHGGNSGLLVQKGNTQGGFSIFGGCIELHDSMAGSDTQCPIVVPTDGQWHHVAISVTATPVNLKWWLDGKVAATSSSTVLYQPAASLPLLVGAGQSGDIDELLFWDHAL